MVDASTLAAQVERDLAKFAKKACQGFVCEQVRIFDVYGERITGRPEESRSEFTFSRSGAYIERRKR